tara:strand:+ start:701 stop:910 length:210 start_codon:yes stop_codon:yes gene_type:complete
MDFVTKLDSAKHTLTAFANAAQRQHPENHNAYVAGYLESAMAYAMANMSDQMFADEMKLLNKTIKRLKT